MIKRMECVITGRVQMVMFRDFTTRKARKLGLVGFVQNKIDGSVYVLAEGGEDKLQELLTMLYKGSILSRVDSVKREFIAPTGEFVKFTIKY